MKTHIAALAALVVAPALLAEPIVTRLFRPVRDARGDENVRRVQDIDDAAWVWAPGHVVWGVAGGAVLSVAVIVGLILWAGDEPGYGPRVRCEDRGRILVGGAHPARWVVDDLQMLGHVMTGRDMRDWYVKHPGAPAVGYLNSVWRIPTDGRVHRLTLAGEAGKDYLKWLKKKGYPEKMPQSVVFLSPPFPPSEIPEELRRRADVSVVIGEFAARYSREYLTPRPDVTIVRNVEIYLPNWMNFVVGPTG